MTWHQNMGHKGPVLWPMCIGTEEVPTKLLPSSTLSHKDMWYQFVFCLFVCFWHNNTQWAMASSFTRFLDHTRRTTFGRTPLDEWSAHRRDLMWHQYWAQLQHIHTILAHLDTRVQQHQSAIIPETPHSIPYIFHVKVFDSSVNLFNDTFQIAWFAALNVPVI